MSEREEVILTKKDERLRDDIIVGRGSILAIMKLSHWRFMEPYLKHPDCPIAKVENRWITRRSLLNKWITQLILEKAGMERAGVSQNA